MQAECIFFITMWQLSKQNEYIIGTCQNLMKKTRKIIPTHEYNTGHKMESFLYLRQDSRKENNWSNYICTSNQKLFKIKANATSVIILM